jgi:gamma-glutamylcyclotransferase (GGCT)/AIG2-like uncharacterized protein YtfP
MENSIVAVYGSLRKGLGNHGLLQGSEFIGTGKVSGYGMYSLGGFPAMSNVGAKSDAVVEVYSVDEVTMARLDRLEGYPSFYNRSLVAVLLDEGEGGVATYASAWMYHIDEAFDNKDFVASGDWVKYFGGER